MTTWTEAQRTNDYERVLQTLRRDDADVRFCVRCGSHVYGTAGPSSDQDFLVVLSDPKAPRDLIWGRNLNVIVHGSDSFAGALDDQSVFAHEGLFAPAEHRHKDAAPSFSCRVQRAKLFDSAQGKADSDWAKAKSRFTDEPTAAKKRALHSLRVLAFARQLAELGKIVDFQIAVPWWRQLQDTDHATWDVLAEEFLPIREQLVAELRRCCGDRR